MATMPIPEGGTIEMPIADQPWGDYYGSFKDMYEKNNPTSMVR